MPFIRFMLRWTRRVLLTLSAVLCLAFCVLWIRGNFVTEAAKVDVGYASISMFSHHGKIKSELWFGGSLSTIHVDYCRFHRLFAESEWAQANPFRIPWWGWTQFWPGQNFVIVLWPTWVYAAIFAVPPVLWWLLLRKRRPLMQPGFPVVTSPTVPVNGGKAHG